MVLRLIYSDYNGNSHPNQEAGNGGTEFSASDSVSGTRLNWTIEQSRDCIRKYRRQPIPAIHSYDGNEN